jgi:WD40 repeat protein
MRRFSVILSFFLLLLVSVGIIAGQTDTQPAFELEQAIGLPLPRSVLYEPNFERYAIVDAYGALMFTDAHTYEIQHILYNSGDYTDFAFSHDGRWFVLTIDTRIELWDTQSFTIVSQLTDLSQALRVHGPLTFSEDDNLLLFYGTYPESQSLRRTEFDTQTIPWIWNLTSARNEGDSTFPANVEAYPFFDYRNGFVMGPENRIVAALPGRLHVIDAYSLDVLFEIETLRYEQDPLIVVFSARDNNIYVRPLDNYSLIQVDTQRGVLVEIPLGTALTRADLDLLGGIELGTSAQVIDEAAATDYNPLIGLFLGEDYRDVDRYGNDPLTITLIDLVVPPTGDGDRVQALLFLFDEEFELGYFFTYRPYGTQQIALSPDGNSLMFRRSDETVEIYDIASGERTLRVTPALRGVNFYSWQDKNRVLSYTIDGTEFVSDFERFDIESAESLQQDLRYSRRFERFFWGSDSQSLVTLSGNEWRLFDLNTGEVSRREALPLRGSIVATSTDGYRYLTDTGFGRAVYDVNTSETRSVEFIDLPARPISGIYTSPDWEHYLVVYSENSWGSYYPGNEIAMYGLDEGFMWFVAGDDLTYPEERQYGWVDNETVYIIGSVISVDQPHRVYDLEFAPSGVPQCLADTSASDEEAAEQALAWEALTRYMTSDELGNLTNLICGQVAQGVTGLELLQPTATLPYMTATPILIVGVPPCLTIENPTRANEMADLWADITAGLNADEIAQAEALLCEGIGPTATPRPNTTYQPPQAVSGPQQAIETMFIDAATGERATGSYLVPPYVDPRPMEPLAARFRRTMFRDPGLIALSPDKQLMASSSLPGELLIYRVNISYDGLLAELTATAISQLATAQLIAVLPSPTATYNIVGTPRPTMTPTITPTSPPLPDERTSLEQDGEREAICPAETLASMTNLPEGFEPSGRIFTVFGTEDYMWVVQPETGERNRDESLPLCYTQLNCQYSWDRHWMLVTDFDEIYVSRPDGTQHQTLFDETDEIWPYNIYWEGTNLLIYELPVPDEDEPSGYAAYVIRDYIDRDDDPEPWHPRVEINGETAEIVNTAYSVGYVLVRTTFSTGLGPGYRYYTYNIDTGELGYFSRLGDYPPDQLGSGWVSDAFGTRLFYSGTNGVNPPSYVFNPSDNTHYRVGERRYGGTASPDRRYRIFSTDSRSQPIGVWDTQTGFLRTYCLPETGARRYEGSFLWSPDSRYVVLQTTLPRDESQEGVGQHTLILDTVTGVVADLTTSVGPLITWTED